MPDVHAILAPSAAKRWMACPPSARLEAKYPEVQTSYTIEGTLAHSVGEILLTYYRDSKAPTLFSASTVSACVEAIRHGDEAGDDKYFLSMIGKLSDVRDACERERLDFEAMLETVHDNYVYAVYTEYLGCKKANKEAVLLVEARLNLSIFIPEGFGSSDAVIISSPELKVFDLKYGKGVKVYSENNEQMMCYALGALCGPGELYDIDTVAMTIIQPRLQHESSWSVGASSLRDWGFNELAPAAKVAFRGEGDLRPGEHCRFCDAAAECPAMAVMAEGCMEKGKNVDLLKTEDFAKLLPKLDLIKTWCSKVEERCLSLAMAGEPIPGFKVVEGRSIRRISDADRAMGILRDAGFDEDTYIKPRELKNITDLEKVLRKATFNDLLGGLVIKPQGKPTLVADSDPRPAISDAASDFDNLNL